MNHRLKAVTDGAMRTSSSVKEENAQQGLQLHLLADSRDELAETVRGAHGASLSHTHTHARTYIHRVP